MPERRNQRGLSPLHGFIVCEISVFMPLGTKTGSCSVMTEHQPIRTRWDRVLLGTVLMMQVVTLVLLVSVIRDQRKMGEIVAFRDPLSPAPRELQASASVHRLGGDLVQDMERAMEAMSQFPDLSAFLQWENHWDGLRASPSMDIRELGDRCVISVSMPGVKPEDVGVSLDGNLLSVSASTRVRHGGSERFETFERKIHVPAQVGNPDLIQAVLSNDVLRVILPYGNPPGGDRPALSATSPSRKLL